MAEQWYAFYRSTDGELVSIGTVVVEPLPRDISILPLALKPDWAIHLWDAPTRQIVARPAEPPPRDRVDDIMAEPEITLLGILERPGVRNAIIRNLGDAAIRYYSP